MTPACMGGFCAARNQCARHLTNDRRIVSERLCKRGEEMPQAYVQRINLAQLCRAAKGVQ